MTRALRAAGENRLAPREIIRELGELRDKEVDHLNRTAYISIVQSLTPEYRSHSYNVRSNRALNFSHSRKEREGHRSLEIYLR